MQIICPGQWSQRAKGVCYHGVCLGGGVTGRFIFYVTHIYPAATALSNAVGDPCVDRHVAHLSRLQAIAKKDAG